MTFFTYLACIVVGLVLSLFFFYVKRRKKLQGKAHLFIFFIVLYAFSFELYAYFLVEQGYKNVFIYNLFFVFGETLLILFYIKFLAATEKIKRIILYFIILFSLWAVINSIYFQSPDIMFQHYTHLLGSLGVVVFSCTLMYRIFMVDRADEIPLLGIPHFWNIAAILLFYSGSFIYFGSLNITWALDSYYLTILASLNRVFAASLYLLLGFSYYSPLIFLPKSGGR
jgi:hypothetical protein